MQSSTFGRLCITQRIDLRGTYNCPKKEVHYTDIDLIALDKGEISVKKVVDQLMDKMEQYANFGFSYMQEKMEVDPNYFFKETAFLHTFLSFLNQDGKNSWRSCNLLCLKLIFDYEKRVSVSSRCHYRYCADIRFLFHLRFGNEWLSCGWR